MFVNCGLYHCLHTLHQSFCIASTKHDIYPSNWERESERESELERERERERGRGERERERGRERTVGIIAIYMKAVEGCRGCIEISHRRLFGLNKYRAVLVQHGQCPDSKFHGPNMGPIWGRQDPGGPHVVPMNFVIWVFTSIHPIDDQQLSFKTEVRGLYCEVYIWDMIHLTACFDQYNIEDKGHINYYEHIPYSRLYGPIRDHLRTTS